MGDNHKRYNAIKQGLEQLHDSKVAGHFQHNLNTLALIVNGIIGAGSVQFVMKPHSPAAHHRQ